MVMAAAFSATGCDKPKDPEPARVQDSVPAQRRHSSFERPPSNKSSAPKRSKEDQHASTLQAAGENTASSHRDDLPDEIIDEWLGRAGRDPQSTMRQVLALPEAGERTVLLEWILAAWTSDDRSDALEWAQAYLNESPAPAAEELIHGLLAPWAVENPRDALQWVRTQLPSPYRMLGESVIASSWAESDPLALANWIDSQAEATISRVWHEELVNGLIQVDPTEAYARAERMPQDERVTALKGTILRSWLLEDPDKLNEWLQGRPDLRSAVEEIRAETENP